MAIHGITAKHSRSRVSNGSTLHFGHVDGRSAAARRWRDLYSDFIKRLGGEDIVTEMQRQLCRRAATLAFICEQSEAMLARGEIMEGDEYLRTVGVLHRLLLTLGLVPGAAKADADEVSDLHDYLRLKSSEAIDG